MINLIDEKGNIIDKKIGFDFGKARMGFPVSKKIKVFNASDKPVYDVTLYATGKDESYNWKEFKMYDTEEVAVKRLSLGNLAPYSYLEGVKKIEAEFIKDMLVSEVWNTGKIDYLNSSIRFNKNTGEASGVSGGRILFNIDLPRDLEVEFKTHMEVDKTFNNYDTTIINFPVRMNSTGNRKGYCVAFKRRRSDDKLYAAVYKDGLGMTDNDDRDYGTNLMNTGWIEYNENQVIKFKIYNNLNSQPCIEIYLDGKQLELMDSLKPNIKTKTFVDKTDTPYVGNGRFYLDYYIWNGDKLLEISDMKIKTEIPEHFITVQTVVGYDAVNNKEYNSYINVSYKEGGK